MWVKQTTVGWPGNLTTIQNIVFVGNRVLSSEQKTAANDILWRSPLLTYELPVLKHIQQDNYEIFIILQNLQHLGSSEWINDKMIKASR
jgi:hypothetical protein